MGIEDELDDLLDADLELEAAFRDLTAQAGLDELKRRGAGASGASAGRRKASSSGSATGGSATGGGRARAQSAPQGRSTGAGRQAQAAKDPLGDLKAALDGEARPQQRYLVVMCPSCSAKNRVPLERLRARLPVCGRCKTDLSFLR